MKTIRFWESIAVYEKIDGVKCSLQVSIEKADGYLSAQEKLEAIAKEAYDKGLRSRSIMPSDWDYLQTFCALRQLLPMEKPV